ncbi:MAG TPA: sigma-70 family RNA polymerase sigma factor [Gemmataceae bacterium]|nr:sigma-70 family RNA polymerase sigma factor [Gemmataceae bacterium]
MDPARLEVLIRLLTSHQNELFRFIMSLHPYEEDARDILQETSVALCRKIEEYDPDQPFLPWAFGFAYLEVLKQRENNGRAVRLLSRDLVDRLELERREHEPLLQARLQALEECLQKLPAEDGELIRGRYHDKITIEELVEQSGASRRSLFRNLHRIRRLLHDCIDRQLGSKD